jgi:lipid II:glycine glycyltransferase (peptidoglycan interpeptide bridge formation enzyme)
MIKIISDDFSVNEYNNIVFHPLQTWEWGEARKKTGVEVLRLGEYKLNDLVNVFQLSFHKIPKTNFKVGYLPRSVLPSTDVLNFLSDYSKKNRIIFIKIEPNIEKSKIQSPNFKTNPKSKVQISKHPLFPEWTQVLDLSQSEEELLKNFHSKTRYNIRLAEKKGVEIKEMSDDKGFEIFSKLYFETCKRQKYFGHNPKYHKIIWDNLKNSISHILIAFYNDVPLAAYELFYFKNKFYYPYGGTSLEYRNIMPSNLLMWEAIKLGKKLGANEFDMWGSLGPNYNTTDPWSGFTRFKEGYNTKFVEFIGSYDLVVSPFLYEIYNFIYSGREIYLKLR